MFAELVAFARQSRWQRHIKATILSPRELEILGWIADGSSNKEIAQRLCLSLYTVKNHVHNILEKMQVSDRREAVRFAVAQGWLGVASLLGRNRGLPDTQ